MKDTLETILIGIGAYVVFGIPAAILGAFIGYHIGNLIYYLLHGDK